MIFFWTEVNKWATYSSSSTFACWCIWDAVSNSGPPQSDKKDSNWISGTQHLPSPEPLNTPIIIEKARRVWFFFFFFLIFYLARTKVRGTQLHAASPGAEVRAYEVSWWSIIFFLETNRYNFTNQLMIRTIWRWYLKSGEMGTSHVISRMLSQYSQWLLQIAQPKSVLLEGGNV